MRLRLVLSLLGVALILAGAGFVYWPAALVLAGLALLAVGLLTHVPEGEQR